MREGEACGGRGGDGDGVQLEVDAGAGDGAARGVGGRDDGAAGVGGTEEGGEEGVGGEDEGSWVEGDAVVPVREDETVIGVGGDAAGDIVGEAAGPRACKSPVMP